MGVVFVAPIIFIPLCAFDVLAGCPKLAYRYINKLRTLDAPVGGEMNNLFLPLMIYDIWNCMPNFMVYTVKVLQVLLTDVRLVLVHGACNWSPSRNKSSVVTKLMTVVCQCCEFMYEIT